MSQKEIIYLVLVLGYTLAFMGPQRVQYHSLVVTAKDGKMPIFNTDEEEELKRILANAYKEEGDESWDFNFEDNQIQRKGKKLPKTSGDVKKKKVERPNANWRDKGSKALPSSAAYEVPPKKLSNTPREAQKMNSVDAMYEDSNLEFNYDDLEAAMMEEQMQGMYSSNFGLKNSRTVFIEEGLKSGDTIAPGAWDCLHDSKGEATKLSKVAKVADVICLIADPRRGTNEFRLLMEELNKIPKGKLGVETVAVNADDWNDHRKYLKKNTVSFQLLSDNTKSFMKELKCTGQNRLSTALVLIEASSSRVLKIWYEDAWDTFNTKDLIVEEVTAFRKDSVGFVERQIGIR